MYEVTRQTQIVENIVWEFAKLLSTYSKSRFPMSAVIVDKKGRILGYGYNSNKTHPRYGSKKNYMTLHAEGSALYCAKKLKNNVEGASIYVFRKGWRKAKPCVNCLALLDKEKISKVIYSDIEQ